MASKTKNKAKANKVNLVSRSSVYQPKFVADTATVLTKEIWDTCMNSVKRGEFVDEFTIGPDMAKYILSQHNPVNRTVNRNHVASLTRDMKNGNWMGHVGDEMTIDRNGHLINSQHRLHAVVEADTPQRFTVRMGVDPDKRLVQDRGRVKSEADLLYMDNPNVKYRSSQSSIARMLYAFMNDQSRPQSYITNTKPTTSELKTITSAFGQGAYDSLIFVVKHGIKTVTVETNAAVLHFLMKNSDFGHRADEFFEGLASGVNLDRDDPRMVIRNRLLNDKGVLRGQKNKDIAMGLIIKGWNAWVAGKKWSSKEHTPDSMPKISGLSKVGSYQLYDTLI